MSINSKGYFPGIDHIKLYKLIKTIDSNAKLNDVNLYKGEMWELDFKFKNEDRNCYIHSTDLDEYKAKSEADAKRWSYKETDHFLYVNQYNLPNNTKGISISLNFWGSSIFLIKFLGAYFDNGYILEKDVNKKYKKIEKKDWLDYLFFHKTTLNY